MKMMLRAITKKYLKLLISVTLIASLGFSLAWGLSSGYASLEGSLNSYVKSFGYPDGYITTEVTSASDGEKLLAVDGVIGCDTRLCADTVMKTAAGDLYSVRVFSYGEAEKQSFYRWSETEGVRDGVLLEYNFALSNGISAGDSVSFRVRGEYRVYVVEAIVSRPETLAAKISDSAWGINYDFGYVYAPVSLLRREYEKDYAENKNKLDENSDELSANKAAALDLLTEKEALLNKEKNLLKEKLEEFQSSKAEADEAISQLNDAKEELMISADELNGKLSELEAAYETATQTQISLKEQHDKLSEAKSTLDRIDSAKKKLEEAQNALNGESVRRIITLLDALPADTRMSSLFNGAQTLSGYLSAAKEYGFSYDISEPITALEEALQQFIAQINEDLSYLHSQEVTDLIEQADTFSDQYERYSALAAVLRRYSGIQATDGQSLKKAYQTAEANLIMLSDPEKQRQIRQALDLLKTVESDRTAEAILADINDARSGLSLLADDTPIEQMTVGEVKELYDTKLSDTADAVNALDESRREIVAQLSANGVDEASLSKTMNDLTEGLSAAEEAQADIQDARTLLSDGLTELYDGIAEIDSGIAEINGELSDGQSKLTDAEKEISDGETKLADAAKEMKTFSDLEDELESAYKELEDGEGYDMLCNQFLLYLDDSADADTVIDNAKNALSASGIKSCYSYRDSPVKKRIDSNLEPLSTLMSLLPAIFFAVVLIVVFLFMSMIIRQSRRDIGILMSLGISKASVRSVFCLIGTGVALCGIIIGIGTGFLLRCYVGGYFKEFFPLPEFTYVLDMGGFFTGAAACIAVCTAAALLSTVMISRVTPKEAMSRPVRQNVRIPALLARITRSASPLMKYNVISLLRNKGRFIFSTVCVAASIMLIFTSLSFIASKNYVITQTFDNRIHYDCQIFFDDEPSQKLLDDIEKIDGVAEYENIIMYDLPVSTEKAEENASLYAISSDNSMIGISDTDGISLAVKPGEIVMEKHLADSLGVAKGDRVTVGAEVLTVGGVTEQCVNRVQYISLEDAEALGKPELYSMLCRFDGEPRRQLLSILTEYDGYLYSVFTDSLFEYNDQLYSTYDLAAWILILFAVVIGFIIVFNTALTDLQDNKRELCVLRTLGFPHGEISLSRFSRSLLQFAFSSVIGLPAGVALAVFTLQKISTVFEEYAYASGIREFVIVLLIVFLYIAASHFSAMQTMKKWNHIEAVKDKE